MNHLRRCGWCLFRPQPLRRGVCQIIVQQAERTHLIRQGFVPAQALVVAAIAEQAPYAGTAAPPARTTGVVVIDVHSRFSRPRRPADCALTSLVQEQSTDELLGHVVVIQTHALRVAFFAVGPWAARRVEYRVVGHRFVLSAVKAFDNAAADHLLNRSVCPLYPERREFFPTPPLLVVPSAESLGRHRSAAPGGLAPLPGRRGPVLVDRCQRAAPSQLGIVGHAQPSDQGESVKDAIARPTDTTRTACDHRPPLGCLRSPTHPSNAAGELA